MKKPEAKIRIEKLKKTIQHHRYLYHVRDKQEISDAALDSLKHELYGLEQEFPSLMTADSPTQRVGGQPAKGFKKVAHQQRMLSLEDVFDEEELRAWEKKIQKLVNLSSLALDRAGDVGDIPRVNKAYKQYSEAMTLLGQLYPEFVQQ